MFESLTPEELEAIRGAMTLLFWLGIGLGGIVGAMVGSIMTALEKNKKST